MRDKQLAAVLHEGEEEVQGPSRRKEIQELLWACQSDNMAEDTLQWEGEERGGKMREKKGGERESGDFDHHQDKSEESMKHYFIAMHYTAKTIVILTFNCYVGCR